MKGTKGTNGSCREVLEAKMEKKLPARHNLVGLPSPDLTLPHPYARIPVFSPFKSILSGDFGRKKCWDPNTSAQPFGAFIRNLKQHQNQHWHPSAESRDLFGNEQMRFIGTPKVGTNALGQLLGSKQAIRFDDGLFPMHPLGLNGIEPGTLSGQQEG